MKSRFLLLLFLASFPAAGCKSKAPTQTSFSGGLLLSAHSTDGRHVLLGDGSSWTIQPVAQEVTMRWQPGDPVEPRRIGHPAFPFLLINHRSQSSALARPEQFAAPTPASASPRIAAPQSYPSY